MQTKSIWLDGFDKPTCESLNKDIEVDVLIIGGGLTGMSCAYHLRDSHLKIAVVERNIIGNGVTSKTTGKLTYLQDHIANIKEVNGLKKTKQYIDAQIEGMNLVCDIVSKHQIDCDLRKIPHCLFVYENLKKLNEALNIYSTLGYPIKQIKNGFYVEDSYVFHPLKYIWHLKEICLNNHISIYEKTAVFDIQKCSDGYLCSTKDHTIKTKNIVLAVHYPYFTIPFYMPLKSHLQKSYILAYQVDKAHRFSAISLDEPITSMRTHHNYQFHLSGTHSSYTELDDESHFKQLVNEHPNYSYLWSNKDIMTYDGLPFIGSIDDHQSMYLATGYNTWGMTNASLAGKMIADQILNRLCQFHDLFDCKRRLNCMKVKHTLSSIAGYTKAYIQAPLTRQSCLRYEKRDGKKVAIYVDENKNEHIVYPICPHLKCALLFNEREKTWDCPCHGSRFDIDGHVLEGPSQYDISYKRKREA